MSWKTVLFFASTCAITNQNLRADEAGFIEPSANPPVIVYEDENRRYDVHDSFLSKRRNEEGHIPSLAALFPHMNEVTTVKGRPPLMQELVASAKVAQEKKAAKPKLTIVVKSEPNAASAADLEPAAGLEPEHDDFVADKDSVVGETAVRKSRHQHHRPPGSHAHGHHGHQHGHHHGVAKDPRPRWFPRLRIW